MDYEYFLNSIINDGIEGAKCDYNEGNKLQGAIDGFEACRNLNIEELKSLLKRTNDYVQQAFRENHDNYWYFRCYQAEIEFVISRMSVYIVYKSQHGK